MSFKVDPMLPSLLRGAVVAGAAGLVAALPDTLGLTSPWPVLLVVAVALARPMHPGPIAAVVVGAAAWWIGMGLRAGVLADTTSSLVIAAVVAVLLCTAVAAVSGERLPLWASLVGIAAFGGIYEPMFAAEPTRFMSQSLLALATVGVAVGIGALTGVVADLLGTSSSRAAAPMASAPAGEVA